jgi:hypothetical protein
MLISEMLLMRSGKDITVVFGVEIVSLPTVQKLLPVAMSFLYFSCIGLACQRLISITVFDTIIKTTKPIFFYNNLEYSIRPSSFFEFSFLLQDTFKISGLRWIFNIIYSLLAIVISIYTLRLLIRLVTIFGPEDHLLSPGFIIVSYILGMSVWFYVVTVSNTHHTESFRAMLYLFVWMISFICYFAFYWRM